MKIGPTWTTEYGSDHWSNASAPGYKIKDIPGGYEVFQGDQLLEQVTFFAEAVAAVDIAIETAKAALAEMGE